MQSLEIKQINLDQPRFDQSTYFGRCRHFFNTTNPLNILCTGSELASAKDIVTKHRNGESTGLSEDELWKAKNVYDSAFHPDTGEKMVLIGRMSAQVPMCMIIGGCMLTFYKSTREVVFWQWFNQSFNAVVNYTNRSGKTPITVEQLGTSYVFATTGALAAALGLNALVKKSPPLVGRFVPFAAIAVANCINIPLMRMKEINEGIPVMDKNGNELGNSKAAAKYGITAVTFSRIVMAAPGFVIPPFFMNYLEKRGFLARYPRSSAPIQILFCGLCYTFATPLACALFPQKASISVSSLEPEIQDRIRKLPTPVEKVYFNKGL
ncbi:sideroflexin-1 [Folsomia candida]|uniref:Sidoreflexin n=1 Tax=Folsomia candida TaxID=158441 RepID=A0A226EKY2_FOLCA|nr:sideroflexin-1 [Folsomia candida]OXA57960.1 Sideroflexin-1 [Folsomia candida]